MPHEHINPSERGVPGGYTHVVIAHGGRTIYVAGQVATDPQGQLVGEGDLARQAEQVFHNLNLCLAAAGATFDDVVKLTTYVVNYKPEDRPAIVAARDKYWPAEPPATTLVGVQALGRPGALIEVEATAVLP
jgi:enamine deaminase RidA (YjgF/YER057c/UK114 family)